MPEQISDEGVICPKITPDELRFSLDLVRRCAAQTEAEAAAMRTARWLDRWANQEPPRFPVRPITPRRLRRSRWAWRRAEPNLAAAWKEISS